MAPLPEKVATWLQHNLPDPIIQAEAIPQDGSLRQFWRIKTDNRNLVLMYSPHNVPETKAWHHIRAHLSRYGLPVPQVLTAQPENGLTLMQDLGVNSLQHAANAKQGQPQELMRLYMPVLDMLTKLQAQAEQGFDVTWCFDGPCLDAAFVRIREMDYFNTQVLQRLRLAATGLHEELELIAQMAAAAQPWGLVHRDFQSRNLVLDENNKLGLVDFQGTRLGPAQYDLASLLNDPYVDLPLDLRSQLFEYYLRKLAEERPFDKKLFRLGWPWVALSRNMQALAAYFFLSFEKDKPHFKQYISPALKNLKRLLSTEELKELTVLRKTVAQISDQ